MTDVALVWNPATGTADIAIANGDIVLEHGLQTAVILSLFTDRLAQPGDVIPDGSGDRRGNWNDLPIASAPDRTTPDFQGSRLWLLDRALQTQETLNRAESYALEALAWMKADGVAGDIKVTASYPQLGWITLQIDIFQAGGLTTFNFPWQNS